MYVGFVGSRGIKDYSVVEYAIRESLRRINCSIHGHVIVSGGARGVDNLAARFAIENDVYCKEYKPDWDTYGASAGFIRNKLIVEQSDVLIAIWDHKSKGTAHTISLARQAEIPVCINGKWEGI